MPEPGVPESFKVLIKELQSLGLDVKLYSDDDKELEIKENVDDSIDLNLEDDKKVPVENLLNEEFVEKYVDEEVDDEPSLDYEEELFVPLDEDDEMTLGDKLDDEINAERLFEEVPEEES